MVSLSLVSLLSTYAKSVNLTQVTRLSGRQSERLRTRTCHASNNNSNSYGDSDGGNSSVQTKMLTSHVDKNMTSWLSLVTQLTYTNIAGSPCCLTEMLSSQSHVPTHTHTHNQSGTEGSRERETHTQHEKEGATETHRRHADFSKLSITHAMSDRSS